MIVVSARYSPQVSGQKKPEQSKVNPHLHIYLTYIILTDMVHTFQDMYYFGRT
jgi:hypothetical protein